MASVLERTKQTLDGFERQEILISGIKTVVYSAGKGDPLVYLHGSGTFTGFEFARSWLKTHRVIIPYHPGFGESGDDDRIETIQDYVLHYLDLFDVLGLDRVSLVGVIARWLDRCRNRRRTTAQVAESSSGFPRRVDDEGPAVDRPVSRAPKDLGGYLVADPSILTKFLPDGHDIDFLTLRYRETTSSARLTWERPGNPKLAQWLHRITTKTLLLWGEGDRVKPLAQADVWLGLLPDAQLEIMKGVGHLPLDEQPAAAELVLSFLNGQLAAKKTARITERAS